VRALAVDEKRALLDHARRTLNAHLAGKAPPSFKTESPALLAWCAAFVTLRRRDTGELRGCRGECYPSRPLVDSVALMTIAAATDDSRMEPVTLDEVPELRIEISALTPLKPIEPGQVEVGRHGLMISKGGKSGLLLPKVAIRYGWDREGFLKALCQKAGLPKRAWRDRDARLFAFESDEWGEEK
jgi:AmmeMemoRadiSam system protein A